MQIPRVCDARDDKALGLFQSGNAHQGREKKVDRFEMKRHIMSAVLAASYEVPNWPDVRGGVSVRLFVSSQHLTAEDAEIAVCQEFLALPSTHL
jgi:hypothetical protein